MHVRCSMTGVLSRFPLAISGCGVQAQWAIMWTPKCCWPAAAAHLAASIIAIAIRDYSSLERVLPEAVSVCFIWRGIDDVAQQPPASFQAGEKRQQFLLLARTLVDQLRCYFCFVSSGTVFASIYSCCWLVYFMLWDVDGAYSMPAYTRLDFRHIRALFVGLKSTGLRALSASCSLQWFSPCNFEVSLVILKGGWGAGGSRHLAAKCFPKYFFCWSVIL